MDTSKIPISVHEPPMSSDMCRSIQQYWNESRNLLRAAAPAPIVADVVNTGHPSGKFFPYAGDAICRCGWCRRNNNGVMGSEQNCISQWIHFKTLIHHPAI